MKRALSLLCFAVATGFFASGCMISRAGGRAIGSFFASPRKVENKLTDPIDKQSRLSVLWVGHATALVQIDDKVILTDPVFTTTVGQVSKRLVEPGIDPENLPKLDAVLVSHVHFDHLSLGTLSMLERKIRMLLMPRGGVQYLTDFGFPVLELRAWQGWEEGGLRVTAAPVQHNGWRYGADEAWVTDGFTGYVVEYHGLKVYFGGDTAYDTKNFVETRLRFPGIELALLPIGPIEPHDFMRRVHMDPAEAVQAFIDLGARRMVPVHYDTFVNSTDNPGDALGQLEAAQKKWQLGERQITPLRIGERRSFVKKGETPDPFVPIPPPPRFLPAPPKPAAPTKKDPAPPSIPDEDRLD